ncbi:phosphatidylserine decarboxylase [Stieleria varia]|uniref:Phosphatidylserine decarboxylase proenzyme n=1 Tax=Stieleria varia TaxID=2528005 RepID=A0A5C6B316_9BACT|nr:phosphatidylserine decarboxylase [Stieleria varia]TWU05892.1 Phosphatidylserine decarboxylase proenzyme [Stieleria varia]
MDSEPIYYFDRYRKEICEEKIYGEGFLRWTYESLGGKLALAAMVKHAWFSRWYGWRMDRPKSRAKVAPFIRDYLLDPNEFVRSPDEFEHFNAFFYRELKPSARPVDDDPQSVVFPADGRHLCVPDLSRCEGLFVKGEMFDLRTLVGDSQLADRYANGSLLLSRLCPVDYHRFHFPTAGIPGPARLIPGPLLSVNPIALRQNIQILATNKRALTVLQTERLGDVLVMEIGATCVGSICQTYEPGQSVAKGDEKGFFRFGGSSTIMIFEPDRIVFDEDLREHSANQVELFAKVGDSMGKVQ